MSPSFMLAGTVVWISSRALPFLFLSALSICSIKRHMRLIQNNQYLEQHNNWRVRAVPRLGELHNGICLTTEEKARKNLSQGSRV
jgi:hypothetical protein